ncbi:hypothetical protein [Nonomuraea sp. SYSU D8015]|uniref:hypothetical protein n=1 Tax=Nonomuraea sp. SYSU D8015 TaxID=2593644 RepID=UPI001660A738|nr:hypothetical protein [Nonomuraea sp. SYSU D8015]
MRLPADWETEPGTGYWGHLSHLIHKPCGFRTGNAYDLIVESNNIGSVREVVYGHYSECSAREPDDEPSSESALTLDVSLTQDQADNLCRAATDLNMDQDKLLAMLAGRVQVESAGRVYLSAEDDEAGGEGR